MTTFFMSTWWGDSKSMEEIEFSRWLFEGRPRQGKNVLPDGLNWLCYFAGSSKSHRENSISCIFLESPHQVDMKNVVKCYKQFFCYFNTLKPHCEWDWRRWTRIKNMGTLVFYPNPKKIRIFRNLSYLLFYSFLYITHNYEIKISNFLLFQ